jgi:hypothetical protein
MATGADSSTLKLNLLFYSVDTTLLLSKSLFVYNDWLRISAVTPKPSSGSPMGFQALGYNILICAVSTGEGKIISY